MACDSTEPIVALRELAECQLRDENCAGLVEPLHDGRVGVDGLFLIWAGAPRRLVSLGREEVLRSPRNSVQRTAILPLRDLRVSSACLSASALFGERDDAVELGIVALEAIKIHVRELARLHPASAHELGESRH